MRNIILTLSLLAACSDSTSVAPVQLAPNKIENEAKFKEGDIVMVEDMPLEFKVIAVGPILEWTNRNTGEKIMSRAYLLQAPVLATILGTDNKGEEVETVQLPEVALTKKP